MNYPLISIAIPTFNSGNTLIKTLDSIKKQGYPLKKIEILIIDGYSKDNTIEIAKKYHCKIIPNPKIDLIYGKHIGFLKSKGKYLMYLDSDEVLENPNSLKIKYLSFKKNSKVIAIVPTGYKSPADGSRINSYVNEFGDPFSLFMYRESKGFTNLIKEFSRKYRKISENKFCVVFSFFQSDSLPLLEFWAGGCMIDKQFVESNFPQIKRDRTIIAQLFYLLSNNQNILIAVTKNDPTVHYSSPNIEKYFKKIASRIRNNIYKTEMGEGGFIGRERFQSAFFRFKKYLFIPYSFSIILPLIDAFCLTTSRKNFIFLLHLPLCIYTSILILYYFSLKKIGIKPKLKNYGS